MKRRGILYWADVALTCTLITLIWVIIIEIMKGGG